MPRNSNTLTAMLQLKCPECHKGSLFIVKNPFKLKSLALMPELCPVCNLTFNPEPGFYWGALYTSYALAIVVALTDFTIVYLLFGWNVWAILGSITAFLTLIAPVLFRYSRMLWLYVCYYYFPGSLKRAKNGKK